MVGILPALAEALCVAGLVQQAAGSAAIGRWSATNFATARPISVLKPLHGVEPLLDSALESFFLLDYPAFQLVFGVEDPADPALALVDALRHRYPQVDVTVVAGPAGAGRNRKVANLIAMLTQARHDLLVVSDADMHVAPGYLTAIAAAHGRPGVGLVTTLYTGLPATDDLAARLGAMQINHAFLPGAALARRLGRQDCLGATMALTRGDLDSIGGFATLIDHLADDNVLGRRVRAAGHLVTLAPTIPATSVTETRLGPLWQHELRWARTIRALVPGSYWGLIVQFPLFWASVAMFFAGFAMWSWLGLGIAAIVRYGLAFRLDQRLGLVGGPSSAPSLARTAPPWLFLLRDWLSAAIFAASFWSDTVEWRGRTLQADAGISPPAHTLGPVR